MKKLTERLTPVQRARGRRCYVLFMLLNAVSVTMLMENVLILYALRNGVSSPAVAVMASFMYLTMPFMILGKYLVARIGLARTWSLCWFLRYCSVLVLIPAPFLTGGATAWMVPLLILGGAFGLFVFRSIGMICNTPLLGEITTGANRGSFISSNMIAFNSSYLVSMILVVLILRWRDQMSTFQCLIGAGALLGFGTSMIIRTIPESSAPRLSARQPVQASLKLLFSYRTYRKLLWAWTAMVVGIVLINPIAVVSLKSGYGISDHVALFFSLVGLVGGIVAAFLSSLVSDQAGPRPMLLIYAGCLLVVAMFWAFAPPVFIPYVVAMVFFLGGFSAIGMAVAVAHYFLSVSRKEDRVGVALFMQMISGLIAGLAGSLGAGGALRLLEYIGYDGIGLYRIYFRMVTCVMLGMVTIMWQLDRLKEWNIQDIFGVFFSFRDLRALFALSRIRGCVSYETDVRHVDWLAQIGSSLSEEALLSYLKSGSMVVRASALRAMRQIDFGEQTEEALLGELATGEYTTAYIAAAILGEHDIRRSIPALRRALWSDDIYLQGECMVALARLGDEDSIPDILRIYESSDNPRVLIHGAGALALLGNRRHVAVMLHKALDNDFPGPVRDSLLTSLANLCGFGDALYRFIRAWNQRPESGWTLFTDAIEGASAIAWLPQLRACRTAPQEAQAIDGLLHAMRAAAPALELPDLTPYREMLAAHPKLLLCIALLVIWSAAGKED